MSLLLVRKPKATAARVYFRTSPAQRQKVPRANWSVLAEKLSRYYFLKEKQKSEREKKHFMWKHKTGKNRYRPCEFNWTNALVYEVKATPIWHKVKWLIVWCLTPFFQHYYSHMAASSPTYVFLVYCLPLPCTMFYPQQPAAFPQSRCPNNSHQ